MSAQPCAYLSRVLGSGSGVRGPGCWVLGAGCRVPSPGCRVPGAGSWVPGPGSWVLDVSHSVRNVQCLVWARRRHTSASANTPHHPTHARTITPSCVAANGSSHDASPPCYLARALSTHQSIHGRRTSGRCISPARPQASPLLCAAKRAIGQAAKLPLCLFLRVLLYAWSVLAATPLTRKRACKCTPLALLRLHEHQTIAAAAAAPLLLLNVGTESGWRILLRFGLTTFLYITYTSSAAGTWSKQFHRSVLRTPTTPTRPVEQQANKLNAGDRWPRQASPHAHPTDTCVR